MIDGLDALTQPLAIRNSNEDVPSEHITMDLGAFLTSVSGGVYYTYLGSLTTPGKYFIHQSCSIFVGYDCLRIIWAR